MKVCVLFGGLSTEHDISIKSALSIISNLDKRKYDIYPVYIDKNNNYYRCLDGIEKREIINNIINYLKEMDVIFPALHGKYGEDGTVQGMLDLIKVPYVGCGVLSSSVCMDKIYTKKLLSSSGINVAKFLFVKKIKSNYLCYDQFFNEMKCTKKELIEKINDYLKYPVFVKASKSGSSIGVYKSNKEKIIENIEKSFMYDNKVLIEENIDGRELEVAVLGNDLLEVSNIGEINNNSNFYTYESKYVDKISTSITKDIDKKISKNIKDIAYKAYKVCDCRCLARVDFFLDKNNNIILNEINTMPGFTSISMYPKLMIDYKYSYKKLLDKLIELAIKNVEQ